MELDYITAIEFLDAENKAARNAADKPPFRGLVEQLEQLPRTKERLVFEMLDEAFMCVEQTCEPLTVVAWIRAWSDAIGDAKVPELLASTEKLTLKYFETIQRISAGEPT